jgi:hypothetical protein
MCRCDAHAWRLLCCRAWLAITRRNIDVRTIAKRVEAVSSKYTKQLAFR